MSLPLVVALTSIEIKRLVKADAQPAPSTGYEIVLVKDLGYTKLWMEFKVAEA